MKKIFFIFIVLMITGCSKPDYKERKKIVIRPIKKLITVSINFDFDRSEIRVEDQEKLDKFIKKLKFLKGTLNIVGHTDTKGKYSYNDALSLRRAVATKEYLEQTINSENYNLELIGKGEYESLVEEITSLDMLKNRRVEIIFKEK